MFFFFFQAEDGIRDHCVTGVQTCALPIWRFPQDVGGGRSADTAALSAAADILGETPSGRLHHELVEAGLAAQVFEIGRASCRERVEGSAVAGVIDRQSVRMV